jgi:predicted alpha-1,2-mannosidase
MGNVFPGADTPFGMVQWSPDTPARPDGGGYYYGDHAVTGFSLTHMSGPGGQGGGDVPILPVTGEPDKRNDEAVRFSHGKETADAGYYRVTLDNHVTTELTATPRTGMARFTVPRRDNLTLVFKLRGGQNHDFGDSFTATGPDEVTGEVTGDTFCGRQFRHTLHFVMRFNKPFLAHGVGWAMFARPHVLLAKVGVSYVSASNAAANLAAENAGWNFNAIRASARQRWNDLLGKIRVTGGSPAQRQVFYTAIYHALLHPNVFSDVNGEYAGPDGKIHRVDKGHAAYYTNISGWDIYRSQAQLEALLDPAVASDTAQSMLDDYAQTGELPKWFADDGESYTMTGDPADAILADYYAFGARSFDTRNALTDMVAEATTANKIRPGLSYLDKRGYLPLNGTYACCDFHGPASTTLEYDTADFALSAFAGSVGNTADQKYFARRAQDWRNLVNPRSGWIQPRLANGTWARGFTPSSPNGFVEGDAWKYEGAVPFDIVGLARSHGGNKAMASYLSVALSQLHGQHGLADMGNEPSMGLPWEYDYIGEPYRTQVTIRRIQDQIWTDAPSGMAGNDDLGTMSAWFVWSALGMYPETPGTDTMALGSPLFPEVTVDLPNGARLTIRANGAPDDYIQHATWNGRGWNRAYAPPRAITGGGTLTFTLGTRPNRTWAASAPPPSFNRIP